MSTLLNDRSTMGNSPIYNAVYRAPWGRRCGYHRAEDAKRGTRYRRHGAAQGLYTLKAQGRQGGAGMELSARSVGEPNDGAVLRAAMAATAFFFLLFYPPADGEK